jgi:hypothetical protein
MADAPDSAALMTVGAGILYESLAKRFAKTKPTDAASAPRATPQATSTIVNRVDHSRRVA